jgi:hypothetical protein
MNEKQKLVLEKISIIVLIAFIVHFFITWLWDYFSRDGVVSPDWKRSILFAVIMGIIIPLFQKKSPSTPQ